MRTPIVPIPMKLSSIAGGALMCAVLASSAVFADAASSSAPHEAGAWQKHEYSFAYMGFTSTYSCDGLASKLKLLLMTSGARPGAKAQAGACASGFGHPDKFARADLTFYTLAPASADKASDGAPVDGTWIPVALAYEQPRTNVLPMFTARNVDNHTTCIPHQESGSVIDLKFESFSVPPKAKSPKQAP